jgi:chaperonin GroES
MKKKSKKKVSRKAPARKAKAVQKSSLGVTPMGDRVLLKPIQPETVTSFGIIIPDSSKEKPEQGVVVAVGPGRRNDSGQLVAVAVQIGDTVMFSKYGYDEIKVNGTEYYLVREESILAVLK